MKRVATNNGNGTMSKKPHIVTIGGGTGTFNVLQGLKTYPVDLTAVVSMADDGGSTGKIRDEFGTLPPGDIRRSLVALARSEKLVRELFEYRFEDSCAIGGHSFGNLFLTALERMTGDFNEALRVASQVLRINGKVVPVTLDNIRLCALLENGQKITGETNIDIPKHDGELKIDKVFLEPLAHANPDALEAIAHAGTIVIGPGDLFTSIVPNLLVEGISEAICASKATVIYISNIMTKWGETNHFSLSHFVATVEQYLGAQRLNYVIVNKTTPQQERLTYYETKRSSLVENDIKALPKHIHALPCDLIKNEQLIRHNPEKLAKAIMNLVC
ncbi:MAG: hypothetical protein UY09_C0051G0005 [Parcubacteria group bacterium GW2011_GWA2_47_8]|nr:MAG: hypothetical protein UY09_C0051G0005 [Parcubacteria group bacterium GW2011_GWA2_47_8]